MTKFKKGDRVVVKSVVGRTGVLQDGATGTVLTPRGDRVTVKIDGDTTYLIRTERLSLLTDGDAADILLP